MIPGVERRALSTLAIRREGRAEQDATVAPKAALEDRNIVRGIVSGRDGRSHDADADAGRAALPRPSKRLVLCGSWTGLL